MTHPLQLAKHFRDVHFGGNWSTSSLKEHLEDVTWKQASTPIFGLNSIAQLVYHIHYYVAGVTKVFEGQPLSIRDIYSFDLPPIATEADWENLKNQVFAAAELFAQHIEQLREQQLWDSFTDDVYGTLSLYGKLDSYKVSLREDFS